MHSYPGKGSCAVPSFEAVYQLHLCATHCAPNFLSTVVSCTEFLTIISKKYEFLTIISKKYPLSSSPHQVVLPVTQQQHLSCFQLPAEPYFDSSVRAEKSDLALF